MAPLVRPLSDPLEMTTKVGTALILKRAASPGLLSVFTLMTMSSPALLLARRSTKGCIIRQGPQGRQLTLAFSAMRRPLFHPDRERRNRRDLDLLGLEFLEDHFDSLVKLLVDAGELLCRVAIHIDVRLDTNPFNEPGFPVLAERRE